MPRTVIVGDVHGCARELEQLLSAIGLESKDRLYCVGDLISRGPDSGAVLRIVRSMGARSVLGNHEWRLLEAYRSGKRSPSYSSCRPSEQRLFKTLAGDDWAWLDSCPLVLDLPEHSVRIVHAGILSGVPVESQSAEVLTRMRSITDQGEASEQLGTQSWAAHYRGEPHVVFGHNAQRGLQSHPYATGLDTGCVYGGSLSALVLEAGERVPYEEKARRERIFSVSAAKVYFEPRTKSKQREAM